MDDTSEEVRALQQAYWMSLSEEERYRRCGRMFQVTKRFAEARAAHGLSEDEKKRIPVSMPYTLALTLSVIGVILLGTFPSIIFEWATRAAQGL